MSLKTALKGVEDCETSIDSRYQPTRNTIDVQLFIYDDNFRVEDGETEDAWERDVEFYCLLCNLWSS